MKFKWNKIWVRFFRMEAIYFHMTRSQFKKVVFAITSIGSNSQNIIIVRENKLPLNRRSQKEKLPTPGQKVGGWVERFFTQKVILRKF